MFFTKRELLRHLGKNENDNKLVDRMIKRGEVVKVADWYDIVENDIEVLKRRIKDLEAENNSLRETRQDTTQQSETLKEGKDTLQDKDICFDIYEHLEYLYVQNEKKNELIKDLTNMIYLKHQDKGWDYAVEYVAKQFGYEADASEEDELAFIKDLLSKHK